MTAKASSTPPGEYLALLTEFETLILDANDPQLPRRGQLPVSKRLNEVRAKLYAFAASESGEFCGECKYEGEHAPGCANANIPFGLSREQVEGWKMNNGAMSPNEFRALCDLALSAISASRWINADEHLPEHENDVLVWHCLGDRAGCDHAYDVAAYIQGAWIFPWDRDRKNNPPQWVRKWKEIERV